MQRQMEELHEENRIKAEIEELNYKDEQERILERNFK
jgi:hypothetical protein